MQQLMSSFILQINRRTPATDSPDAIPDAVAPFNGLDEAGMKSSLKRVDVEEAHGSMIIGNEYVSNDTFISDAECVAFKRTLLFSED